MMLAPLKSKRGRRQITRSKGITAPWRGLNTRDKLETSSTEYAQILDNFICDNAEVTLRNGYSAHKTGLGAAVQTVMAYVAAQGKALFGAAGANIYDVTVAGAVGAPVVSGLASADWISTMYSTTSGDYLVAVNGADGVHHYNGTVWGISTITGVDADTLCFVTEHKGRLWFVQDESLSLWYLDPLAIEGAAKEFPIGSQVSKGGNIVAVSSWSVDASGIGPDDLFVIVTSEGEVVIYKGSDPDTDYQKVGVYQAARPLGKRCLDNYGAELVILTTAGPLACRELLNSVSIEDQSFAELVRADFKEEALRNADMYGWQSFLYAKRGWMMFNVPVTGGDETHVQYVLNSGAWFRLTEQSAQCWAELDGNLYFGGGDGTVYQADIPGATKDKENTPIVGRLLWSWSRFGYPGIKKFNFLRPHMEADATPYPAIQMMTDYSVVPFLTNVPTLREATNQGAIWDEAEWDEADWAGTNVTFSQVIGAFGEGVVGAAFFYISSDNLETFKIKSMEVMFEEGDVFG